MHENVGGRHQHEEVHLAEAAQVEALAAGVCDGAHLGEEAARHAQLRREDLEHLIQQVCPKQEGRAHVSKHTGTG